jgi:outer membrane protein assembly factor BamB
MVHAIDPRTGADAWRVRVPAVTVPPVATGGWLILAGGTGVTALRASDGHQVWQNELGPVRSRPAIDGEFVYVALAGARIAGLDIATGTERWQRSLGGDPGEPYAVGGLVYVGAEDRYFYALDATDGEIEWSPRTGAPARGRPAADDDRVYFVGLDNVLYAFDRGDGALEWRASVGYRPVAGPVIVGDSVVVPGPAPVIAAYASERGASAGTIPLGGRLATIPGFVPLEHGRTHMAVVTGDLKASWRLSLLGPDLVPRLSVAPLTELPGVPVPLGPPDR